MSQAKTNYIALLLFGGTALYCWVLSISSVQNAPLYDTSKPVAKVEVGDKTLSIPSWGLFHEGNMWSLVSSKRTLGSNFSPELAETTLAHAPAATQIGKQIVQPLKALFVGAKEDDVKLMLSSAYRSASDQQTIYNSYLNMYGKEYVHDYVAVPGASEHQTGLAVDIATSSSTCERDANSCSLDATSIRWLRAHAASFGFIERYPSGKQSITGVAGEHWHYRYVGVPLAKALDESGMTLDEFIQQAAPGYATRP